MAMPPIIRQVTNDVKASDQPVSAEETANRIADRMSNFLRPTRPLIPPDISEPRRHPSSAQLFAQPTSCAELS